MALSAFAAALAHVGHHEPGADSLLHVLTQADHLLAAAGAVVVAWTVLAACRRVVASNRRDPRALSPSPAERGQG